MKIALLGDIAFFGKFSLTENKELYTYFKDVSELLKKYDHVIGNLETPFTKEKVSYGNKSAHIHSSPENINLLKYLNIGIVNLANNHIYDFGKEGYDLTKQILKENKIDFFGIEDDQFILEDEENKIVFNGVCCYSTNPIGINSKSLKGINSLNIPILESKIINNHNNGYYNIVSVHCGQEHVNFPNFDHIQLARKIASDTPFIFYGHHPHVAQGLEEFENGLIAYSLGNFCFDDVYTSKSKEPLIKQTLNNKESFILEIEFKNNKLINHKIIPIFLGDQKMEIGSLTILKKIESYSNKLKDLNKVEYIDQRQKYINSFIQNRKNLRDLNWYVKRLNFKSIRLMLDVRSNSKNYFNSVKKHLL
jgi:poly-gamma-glutamate synthesis protein (capsule biosynthesis protein)